MELLLQDKLERAAKSGKFFSATFLKADGTVRNILCRGGVKKHLKGTTPIHSRPNHLVVVWDVQNKGYRSINKNSLIKIKQK